MGCLALLLRVSCAVLWLYIILSCFGLPLPL